MVRDGRRWKVCEKGGGNRGRAHPAEEPPPAPDHVERAARRLLCVVHARLRVALCERRLGAERHDLNEDGEEAGHEHQPEQLQEEPDAGAEAPERDRDRDEDELCDRIERLAAVTGGARGQRAGQARRTHASRRAIK